MLPGLVVAYVLSLNNLIFQVCRWNRDMHDGCWSLRQDAVETLLRP